MLLQLGDGIENEPGVAAQAVQFEDQQLIELVQMGILEQASAQRTRFSKKVNPADAEDKLKEIRDVF